MQTLRKKAKIIFSVRFKASLRIAIINSTLLMCLMFLLPTHVLASKPIDIPTQLKPWEQWVLHDMEERLCPTDYNQKTVYQCVWPSRLELFIRPLQGHFRQEWMVFAKSWVSLPGGSDVWPDRVELDGQEVPVIKRNGIPSIELPEGEHVVSGGFTWKQMPEVIQIPPSSGLIKLNINDQKVAIPVLDKKGRLWLQKRVRAVNEENRVKVRIFRLLEDEIPFTIANHIQLDVSGQAREENLAGVLLKNAIPMKLDSPLPARIGPDGQLMLQARPGRWTVRIITRQEGPVRKIGPVPCKYGVEIWSFKPQNHLRMVKILGVGAIDPALGGVPAAWKKYPAYVIKPKTTMTFRELRRGDPDPAPDRLSLHRTWWLDFDGKGFTIQDKIGGIMSRQWYLAMNPPIELGRIAVDGNDQLITGHGEEKKPGVELRRGHLDLQADARVSARVGRIPVVGWDHDFQKVSGVLNLPPGWRLLTAIGVDVLPGTWVRRWTLLDFFLVLIIALAVYKLKNWAWGVLALLAMGVIYHEVGAPRFVWLNLLAVLALLKVLPEGWPRKLVTIWGAGAVVVLITVSIPFMVQQIRVGIYPQLEQPGEFRRPQGMSVDRSVQFPAKQRAKRKALLAKRPTEETVARERSTIQQKMGSYERKQAVFAQDPNALIQTGPGLPNWQWQSIQMQWNGPVDRYHFFRLWIVPPFANLVLAVLRVILLAVLIFGLVDMRFWWQLMNTKLGPAVAAALLVLLIGWPQPSQAENASSEFPPSEILNQLQERLLEKPNCYPNCADMLRMDVTVNEQNLQILLEVHMASESGVPLPGGLGLWLPDAVLLDQQPIKGLLKDVAGGLWALIPQGVHRLTLIGKTGARNMIQIPIPLQPHRVTVQADPGDWQVQGVKSDGTVNAGIQLIRQQKEPSKNLSLADATLPPFLSVERVLHLGLKWRVSTAVKRLTPPGAPVVISVPLLKGESVTTAGLQVENGKVILNLDAQAKEIRFGSVLEMASRIKMLAPPSVAWTETWILDASPIWHCDFAGIPAVHHQDQQGHWRPEWRPWPGESVAIEVSRPKAIPGELITIDKAHLVWTAGIRLNKAELTLTVRTSRGGQHSLSLPEDANLQVVKINHQSQPIRQKGRDLVIPLQPGNQTLYLEWHQPSRGFLRLKSPRIVIGEKAVNARVSLHMPPNRWILWTAGPRLGPAVLFWSYLFVVILAAIGLGRVKLTPLKTHHWLLLGLGLTQVSPVIAILIVGWLLALGVRGKYALPDNWLGFNFAQVLLVIWTLAALLGLYAAVEKGLLGIPNMQIAGNGSSNFKLIWTQDRIGEILPQAWVIALPQWVFHMLMLFWSLWLAFYLLKWLRWGWQSFGVGGNWKKWKRREKEAKPPPLPKPQTE